MQHRLPNHLRTRAVRVLVVGAGGTGSQVLTALAQLDHAMRALGHPGFDVTVTDPDRVSAANVGRQMFYPADVGEHKSEVLVHRINMAMGTRWRADIAKVSASDNIEADLVLGCVDTRAARFAILRGLERGAGGLAYWLDFGNGKDTGQVVLGQVSRAERKLNPIDKLPHVGELFPEAIDVTLDGTDDTPSCSLAEALEKQSLFVNRAVTVAGMNILWRLFRQGEIDVHGCFVNLVTSQTRPMPVDPEYWARLGYGREKKRIRLQESAALPLPAAARLLDELGSPPRRGISQGS